MAKNLEQFFCYRLQYLYIVRNYRFREAFGRFPWNPKDVFRVPNSGFQKATARLNVGPTLSFLEKLRGGTAAVSLPKMYLPYLHFNLSENLYISTPLLPLEMTRRLRRRVISEDVPAIYVYM